MKLEFRNVIRGMSALFLALSLAFTSCEQFQDSLSSSMQNEMDEEVGKASIGGKIWYYDGISTTDFSSTKGSALAVDFSKKVAMSLDSSTPINDDGTYNYAVSGSLIANYTTSSGQSAAITYKISGNKIILDSENSVTETAGSLNASGTRYSLSMTPICRLLDAATTKGNTIDSLEVKLSGFVRAEGEQKGRSVSALDQKISVLPFYEDETITDGVTFSTISSTSGKYVTIPTKGKVRLSSTASIEFSSSDADALSLYSSDFTLGVSDEGLTVLCGRDLKGLSFDASFKISGFIPELNASSYTRTFTVHYSPIFVTLDGALDENAWESAVVSEDSYASVSGYDLSKVYVTNDSENLYVAVEGDFAFTNDKEHLVILIDNENSAATGESQNNSTANAYYGVSTYSTYSSVDYYLCHILSSSDLQGSTWTDGGLTSTETSATSGTQSVIEYKISLSDIGSATTGNTLKIFVGTVVYTWVSGGEPADTASLQDCIPSTAATVSQAGQGVSIDFAKALSYTIKGE
ncbi:MAG: hypothetical protein IJ630_03445 [Treponema sp.]|nr:hypothetical protein [Treponema sp.]